MKKFYPYLISSFAFLGSAAPAFAATIIDPCAKSGIQNSATGFSALCNLNFEGGLIGALITLAFIIATLIALGFLIFGGIKWITSGGDKTSVEGARNTIVAALVGLVIVFLAYFIIRIVFSIFGLNFGNLTIPNINAG